MTAWHFALAAACLVSSGLFVACLLPARPRTCTPRARQPGQRERRPATAGLSRFRAALAAGTGVGAGLLLGGWLGLVAGAVAAVVMWRSVGRLEAPTDRRRREHLVADLPHVVDLLGCCLEAGTSMTHAVGVVSAVVRPPMRDELRVISSRLALGAGPAQVWSEVARDPQLGALGRCLVRSTESGASVSGAMHRLADDLRRSTQAEVEGRARSVGAKSAAPLGLCLLPAFVLIGVVPLVAGALSGALRL